MFRVFRYPLKYTVVKFSVRTYAEKHVPIRSKSLNFNAYLRNYCQRSFATKINENFNEHIEKLNQNVQKQGRLSCGEVEHFLDALKKTQAKMSVAQSLSVIRCCCFLSGDTIEKRIKVVRDLWKTLEKLGTTLDICHYNALLLVYSENDYEYFPSDVLSDLEKKLIKPDRITFQRLIHRYGQMGDVQNATRLYRSMRDQNMPVNVKVLNALMLGHIQNNDLRNAEKIVDDMKKMGCKPSAETYTFLMCGFIKQGNLNKYQELLNESEQNSESLNNKDYLHIVYTLGEYNYEKEVDKIVHRLKTEPNSFREITNAIYRFISRGKIEVGFKILKLISSRSTANESLAPVNYFFISGMIHSDIPAEVIMKYTEKLKTEIRYPKALSLAMEIGLRAGKEKVTLDLFKLARANKFPIRPHYFWPLLVFRGKKNDISGMFRLLSIMNKEFKLGTDTETVRDYVIPYTLESNYDIGSVLHNLKSCGYSVASGVSAIVINLLSQNNLKKAAELASTYAAAYSPHLLRKPLVNSYLVTKDAPSFVIILKDLSCGIQWMRNKSNEPKKQEEFKKPDHVEHVGIILLDIVKRLQQEERGISQLEVLLKQMVKSAVGISSESAQTIKKVLGDRLTHDTEYLLEKLTSQELALPSRSVSPALSRTPLYETSLERMYENMKMDGELTVTAKKHLFIVYGRKKDLNKLLLMKKELEADGFPFLEGMRVYIIDTFVEHGKCDEALDAYEEACANFSNFNMDNVKLLRFVSLLVENNKTEEALKILQKNLPDTLNDTLEEGFSVCGQICRKLLYNFAEIGDVDNVNKFFNLMTSRKLIGLNNYILSPLIEVHLRRNDPDAAVKMFETCCRKYLSTPHKEELMRYLIQNGDVNNLNEVFHLSSEVHGEINASYDLMFSYLEYDRLTEAKKILMNMNLSCKGQRLLDVCQKYVKEGFIKPLKNLLSISQNMSVVNREQLFYDLLTIYDKLDNPKEAFELWTQMQEEMYVPSDTFLVLFAEMLKRHKIAVPFTLSKEVSLNIDRFEEGRCSLSNWKCSNVFKQLLAAERIDDALKVKKKYKRADLNKWDWSLLIEMCLKKDRYKDAVKIFEEMTSEPGVLLPVVRIFKFLIKTAMLKGDADFIQCCEKYLSQDLKKHFAYDDSLYRAYVNAGRVDECLDILEKKLDNVISTEDFQRYINAFPKGAIMSLLIAKPDALPRVRYLLKKCKDRDGTLTMPDNILWNYFMLMKQFDEADRIWNSSLSKTKEPIFFVKISNEILKQGDFELGQKLIRTLLKKKDIGPGVLGIAYGVTIGALVQKNRVEEAVNLLEEALAKINMDKIIATQLVILKAACQAKCIPFPYTIPIEEIVRNRKNRREWEIDGNLT